MNKKLQQFVAVALMTGGFLVGVICLVTLGASLMQPLPAESYMFWAVLLACCLVSIGASFYLRQRHKKSTNNDH